MLLIRKTHLEPHAATLTSTFVRPLSHMSPILATILCSSKKFVKWMHAGRCTDMSPLFPCVFGRGVNTHTCTHTQGGRDCVIMLGYDSKGVLARTHTHTGRRTHTWSKNAVCSMLQDDKAASSPWLPWKLHLPQQRCLDKSFDLLQQFNVGACMFQANR